MNLTRCLKPSAGFYTPFAITGDGQFLSNGARSAPCLLFRTPTNVISSTASILSLSYQTPSFAQTPYALEIRPIIGVRNKEWEFIVNPIVDASFGAAG